MNTSNLDEVPWDILLLSQETLAIDPDTREVLRKEIIRRCPVFEPKLYSNLCDLIHLASEYGHADIVKELISINPCLRYNKHLKSPLDYAVMKENTEVIISVLLYALSVSATTRDVNITIVEKALYLFLRENQHQAFSTLAIKYMEKKNWDNNKVAIIKLTNKLLRETTRPSDDVPTEVWETLNKLLSSFIQKKRSVMYRLEEFLASNPLLSVTLASRSCPLETQLLFCVLTRQTDELLDEINKIRYTFEQTEQTEGVDSEDKYPMHTCSSYGLIHLVKLMLVYESGSSSLCHLKDMNGETQLHRAVRRRKASVLNTLLETCWESAGLVSDKKNEMALHRALNTPNVYPKEKAKAFRTLLEWYIIKEEFLNNNARDWECGDTTLDQMIACYEKILKELIGQKDSKICFQREFEEGNDYFVVIKCKEMESMGISFKYGDYIRKVTSKTTNRTILSVSMDSKSIITFKVLIRSVMVRGMLDIKDVDGNTVFDLLDKTEELGIANLMGFVQYERYENVIWLLDAIQIGDYEAFCKLQMEDPQILNYICQLPLGGSPLHIAARYGQLNDCTRYIIRKRPHFATTKDRKGRNPIHIAAAKGYLEIVKELLTQFGFSQCIAGSEKYKNTRDQFYHGTPLWYAIEKGRILVIKELFDYWWNGVGEMIREENAGPLVTAIWNHPSEALKFLMEKYIEDELLKAKKVEGSPMSALADGYIEIVSKYLLSPEVNYNLSILVKNTEQGERTGTESPLPLYFAIIKVASHNGKEDHNIVDELQLSAYYPKYFREVMVGDKIILHLSMDNGNSVTLKLLLQSPLFYRDEDDNTEGPFDVLWGILEVEEVVENEMGTLLPIWSNKLSDPCRPSSIKVSVGAREHFDKGAKNGHEDVVADNEKQLYVGAKEDYESVSEKVKNESAEDDIKEPYDQEIPTDISLPARPDESVSENGKADHINHSAADDNEEPQDQDMLTHISIPDKEDKGYTMRNQDRTLFQIQQVFASLEECTNAIRDAAILSKTEVTFTHSGMEKIVADCSKEKKPPCDWKICVMPRGSNFVVTRIQNEHKCPRLKGTLNKLATPKWVSSHIIDKVRENSKISPRDIMDFIKSQYPVDITYRTAGDAKKRALETINCTEPKENTIRGSQTQSRKRKKVSTGSSSLSPNAHPSRRSNLRFLEYIPIPMHEYIQSTEDVDKDGDCGYRVIAVQLGYEATDAWKQVRRELLIEVVQNEELYLKLMDSDTVAKMRKSFAYFEDHATNHQYWLSVLPDAGYVIANAYKAVVVSLSLRSGNLSFLPLLEPPPQGRPHRIITFGFVNGNHFISLGLKPAAPIPQVDHRWDSNVSNAAEVWKAPYLNRIDKFKETMKLDGGDKNNSGGFPVNLDP